MTPWSQSLSKPAIRYPKRSRRSPILTDLFILPTPDPAGAAIDPPNADILTVSVRRIGRLLESGLRIVMIQGAETRGPASIAMVQPGKAIAEQTGPPQLI
jgi:hypothetical protein